MKLGFCQWSNIIIWLRKVSKQLFRRWTHLKTKIVSKARVRPLLVWPPEWNRRPPGEREHFSENYCEEPPQTQTISPEHTRLQKADGFWEDRKTKDFWIFQNLCNKKAIIDATQHLTIIPSLYMVGLKVIRQLIVAQSCLILCDPVNCDPPDFPGDQKTKPRNMQETKPKNTDTYHEPLLHTHKHK